MLCRRHGNEADLTGNGVNERESLGQDIVRRWVWSYRGIKARVKVLPCTRSEMGRTGGFDENDLLRLLCYECTVGTRTEAGGPIKTSLKTCVEKMMVNSPLKLATEQQYFEGRSAECKLQVEEKIKVFCGLSSLKG